MTGTIIPRSSLNAEVVARLRHEIVEGVWRPGERLQERILCERYGVSRSPLREAYQVLATEGLVEISPNRGAIASTLSADFILENYVLLSALEALAIELACLNASDEDLADVVRTNDEMKAAARRNDLSAFLHINNEVHRKIIAASHNRPLQDTHTVVSRQIIRVQNLNGPLEHAMTESINEHDGFLAALVARDRVQAVRLFKDHLTTVAENLERRLAALDRD